MTNEMYVYTNTYNTSCSCHPEMVTDNHEGDSLAELAGLCSKHYSEVPAASLLSVRRELTENEYSEFCALFVAARKKVQEKIDLDRQEHDLKVKKQKLLRECQEKQKALETLRIELTSPAIDAREYEIAQLCSQLQEIL